MKGWRTVMAMGLMFVAQTALADQAKTRDSGSSGSSKPSGSGGSSASSSAGERHHPSASGASSRSAGPARGQESSASRSRSRVDEGSAVAPRPLTEAERRHPRPGTGTGHRGSYRYGGYGYGYNPYYSYRYRPSYGYYGYWGLSPWYYGSSWGWGWDLGYSYDRRPYGYPRYRYRYDDDDDMGSLRLMVEPEETQVVVDGHYAGEVDDFDGLFQRLHVTPGRHEITLKLKGHQTHKVRVYVPRDETLKIHHHMRRGTEGVVTEENLVRPWEQEREQQRERYAQRRERDLGDDEDKDADNDKDADDDKDADSDTGTVRLNVEPRDASVYVDGEFQGAGREVGRIELAPGRHRIEIVRPGYRTAERDVEVKSGRSEDLDVHLEK